MGAEELSAADVMSPDRYAERGYPYEAWAALRREAPVHWFDFGERPGFWAITRRADIVWLSKQPQRFRNAPRQAVFADSPGGESRPNESPFRHLLNMDPPEHAQIRALASGWFTPRSIARRRPEIERLAADLIDGLAECDSADFVTDLAAPLTLSVLADMLGVPRGDWQELFAWTNQIAGSTDPEFQAPESEGASATMQLALDEMFGYLLELAAERRARPRDDILSVLVTAELDGKPVPDFELLSYLVLLIVAGNETTRNAASGGLLALIEHPDQLARLQADPGLVNVAVEETVRFTSPVIQFCRTSIEDFELHGQAIRAGESLCLFYPSANRDAEVFEAPDEFRVDRRKNPHIGFGIGEHFCLGANLARLELRVIFEQLIPRLRDVALARPPERMRSSFLGGVKRMPLHYHLGDAPR